MLRLFLILLSFILVAVSGAEGGALPIAAAAPFRQIVLAHQALAPGAEQALAIALDQTSATTVLQLTVTYADGKTQDVLDQTLGSTASVTWQVPEDAAPGAAAFQLKTGSCGCGDRSAASAAPAGIERTITGYFFVTP